MIKITWEQLKELCKILECWGTVDSDGEINFTDFENQMQNGVWVYFGGPRGRFCPNCPDYTKQINPQGEVV